ncbi:MAG TPA: multicopper oxidase domain-containing protein [Blastocatellia bacterium]|nr:multicopper oxidase domain-containing protein [Blastocatellia bacterium]
MAYISRINRRKQREAQQAQQNRREIVAAQLNRRDLMKLGLLTSAGYLIPVKGLSARPLNSAGFYYDNICQSPATSAFTEAFTPMQVKQPETSPLTPTPTVAPNNAAGEGRTRDHQVVTSPFPPTKQYRIVQQETQTSVHAGLPVQTLWGFDGKVPGPLYIARYGEPIIVRNVNALPANNGGFGINQVSTHLHNGHTPSESDGFPCDYFPNPQNPAIANAFFYDQYYPNVLAGFASTHQPNGDINEAMSSLWYHDHRVDFTSQNVYKGLAGMFNLYNSFDTGDETTGFRLPGVPNPTTGVPDFDVNMIFADRCFDQAGLLFFDLFNLDGILGDKFLVNGKIQPVMHVHPRRYRFRWLNGGPSRFYQFFLTDLTNLNGHNLFWQISNDGNLLPSPVSVESVRLGVAERADVIIDFAPLAGKTLFLENRLEQTDGRGPTGNVKAAGQGDSVLKIIVDLQTVADNSVDPATHPQYYTLPSTAGTVRVTRTFKFERGNGQWQINGQFFDCNQVRFRVQQNSIEQWILQNSSGGWEHPIHIHFEEFQTLLINGSPPTNSPLVQTGRKDVIRLEHNTEVKLFFRFRDFLGRYPMHCHNTIHEDHAMMLRWDLATVGDTKQTP